MPVPLREATLAALAARLAAQLPIVVLERARRAPVNTDTEANAKVAQTLFTMATVDKNVAAAIFWMKARGGWREKHPIDDLKDKAAEPTTFVYRWATAQVAADEGAERDALTASASKRIGRTIDHE